MRNVAVSGERSVYAAGLEAEMTAAGLEILRFRNSCELLEVMTVELDALLMFDPRERNARMVRKGLESVGGMTTHTPMLAAFHEKEMLAETEVLKHFADFIVAPAGLEEMTTRVSLLHHRRLGRGNVLRAGELLVNLEAHRVFLAGRPVDMTYKEFELLKTMASTPGRAYSREELLRSVWGYDYFGGTRTVDVHVRRLRSKIETTTRYIETVHGLGYRFVQES